MNCSPKPFRQVQGAAPNHALTEYHLTIFYVELTLDGYLFLRRKADSDARLVWFSIADELFSFVVASVDLNGVSSKIPVTIRRQSFDTAFGHVGEKSEDFKISLELAHRLISLTGNQFCVDNDLAVKTEDAYKKGLHKDLRFQALGLRNLVRRDAGIVKFAVRYLG
ncbi:MAG: hypothetical protein KJ725_07625 [Gammaproteobacteria bacterium]|uniref:hypothetical protein n=1 Tax=Methylotuvimicrobium sp. TaxID=2822413 RepID=UPI001DB43627|nr:hypothetical protein [Gammaproteobacteria bacterium]